MVSDILFKKLNRQFRDLKALERGTMAVPEKTKQTVETSSKIELYTDLHRSGEIDIEEFLIGVTATSPKPFLLDEFKDHANFCEEMGPPTPEESILKDVPVVSQTRSQFLKKKQAILQRIRQKKASQEANKENLEKNQALCANCKEKMDSCVLLPCRHSASGSVVDLLLSELAKELKSCQICNSKVSQLLVSL